MAAFALTGIQSPTDTPSASGLNVKTHILAVRTFSLDDRYPNESVNKVFAENILLTLGYMDGTVTKEKPISWDTLNKPFSYTFTLSPQHTFAFHDSVLSEYQGQVTQTTNAHFNAQEGFVSDGYLYGDGVCHLASLIDWTAKDAGLDVDARVNHDFAVIPEVPKEYGVAIYNDPNNPSTSEMQNLYVTNNKNIPVRFTLTYSNNSVTVEISDEI